MAITPRQVAEITPEELERADEIEQMIDKIIRQRFAETGGYVWIPLANTSARIRGEVMRRYREAGWIVEYHDDQREGPSLTFGAAVVEEQVGSQALLPLLAEFHAWKRHVDPRWEGNLLAASINAIDAMQSCRDEARDVACLLCDCAASLGVKVDHLYDKYPWLRERDGGGMCRQGAERDGQGR